MIDALYASRLIIARSSVSRRVSLLCLGVSLANLVSCSSSNSLGEVRGQVAVDGAAVDVGSINFKPAENPSSRGSGAAIKAGQFQLSPKHGLKPGKYLVAVDASKPTGKTFKDPQRGDVPVLQSLEIVDSPKEVEVNGENSGQLNIAFTTRRR